MEGYLHLKLVHVLVGVLFLGNLIVTAVWKTLADRTGDGRVIAFAQRVVGITDWAFTLPGALLLVLTGTLMVPVYGGMAEAPLWIHLSMGLWLFSALLWAAVLVPVQRRQGKLAREFADGTTPIPADYWRLGRLWATVGVVATVQPLVAVVMMVLKQPV